MLKRCIRWLLPLIALCMFALTLVFAPIISSHAASLPPAAPISAPAIPAHHAPAPNFYWRPR